MKKRSNKKMINVLTAGLATTALLATSIGNTFAYEENTNKTKDSQAKETEKHNPVVASHQVTLVTGEVVTVDRYADGMQGATVEPASDGTVDITTMNVGGDLYVIPAQAQAYLATNMLDRELFNVTKLIEYGYDDAHDSDIPLIATYSGTESHTDEALEQAAPAGSKKDKVLDSANGVALKANKSKAKTFWEAVDDDSVKAETAPKLADGMKKLWLDKPVQVMLDKSVPQIGAPTAWAAGYDGTGEKVAVLDTGIDPNHPDVKNAILKTKSFIDGQDYVDKQGHGTHVASTIAGSGAASGGKYKGVAPGAKLLIGKVLSNEGTGPMSSVIGGMEWAVDEKADVVSMSLGGSDPSDGTDPLSQAVNNLSSTSNTLFVIAAGNSGPAKGTVAAPGAAEKALTVGAVDKSEDEKLASFSNRGPLLNNFKVKPEITAPGVAIVAARAAGTNIGTPVDANYSSLNGTSMATPHVSGVAAILRQRHPDWSGDQVKQVLIDTAVANSRYIAYQQGGGRVDISKALDANIYSSPAVVSMGAGYTTTQPIVKTFNYVNPSDSAITLNLVMTATEEDLTEAPSGMFKLSQSVVTVPAHGSSAMNVTFNPALGNKSGDYQAVVKASSSDNKIINTTIGATIQDIVNLTINEIDRNGKPAGGDIVWFNLDTGVGKNVAPSSSGMTKLSLQPGRYAVMSTLNTNDKAGIAQSYTLASVPMIELKSNENQEITFDSRLAKEVKVTTPKESEKHSWKFGVRERMDTNHFGVDYMRNFSGEVPAYVLPVKAPNTIGQFEFNFHSRNYAPAIKATYDDHKKESIPLVPVFFAHKLDGDKTLQAVNVGVALPADLSGIDIHGKLAVVTYDYPKQNPRDQIKAVMNAGAAGVIVVKNNGERYNLGVYTIDNVVIPTYTLGQSDGEVLFNRIANGPTWINLHGIADSPYVYNYASMINGEIPDNPVDAVTKENSAVVKAHYRRPNGWLKSGDWAVALRKDEGGFVALLDKFEEKTPDREEWYSTGNKTDSNIMKWGHQYYPDVSDITHNIKTAWNQIYSPGDKKEETWMGAANAPAGPENTNAYRAGDTLNLSMNEFGDSEPGHYGWFYTNSKDKVTYRLYQDGKLSSQVADLANRKFVVSPDPATYKITADTSHPEWFGFTLATTTSTAWTFKSQRPAEGQENLALLWPRYDIGLDNENTAKGGITDHFDLSFVTQSGATAEIKGVEVAVSTDDGNTWSNTKVDNRKDGHYKVWVKNPDSGYVSLRIKAWDANGSKIEQTIIRTYAVR
ncbi:S8 family serine peptidase [Bacillus sp. AFS041924]|uniref:S8 family serine peptidase n=1 Tax=Bacillus sp. AFS041924 TaxID=2033503 RepID=UPI00159B88C2|nr:S8 family serine peptidase [Bacillus sp. AFS041924]